ncbi:hypothetical protein AK812_SmicGene24781 [Symbiodinium microadriaticum]|uniref:Homing endonuclease LAGLIDADG domain-containing protein n=1 Tax=Symbiodinium microadriaticum TaxID=2951 RepID=A0A1Q9DDR2_SYMMI|nr:hypothetical protein AK812_SmicGene24781 [Symbiodinium microadriaticum]
MIALRSHVLLPNVLHARRQAAWAAGLLTPACWVRGSKTLVGPERLHADVRGSFCAEAFATSKEVQMDNKQLRVRLNKSAWPILKCFSAHGQTYSLPLRAESRDLRRLPPEPVLAYLAGFFDGDGCVVCESSLSGCFLIVGQSFDQAQVPMLLYETFGGSITLHFRGRGLQKPALQWTAYGQSARNAAQLLAPQSITKQKQLLLAAQWPEAKSDRKDCKAELRALKEYDSAVAGPCSWEYCAGFFDAEGHIQQPRGGVSLVLQIKQKHPRVLECLREFLAQSSGKDATVGEAGESAHVLWICGLTSCKHILQHLLAAGLLCKAEQAKLALGLTPETAAQVDAELGCLTGNQMFGKRLDAAGRQRAKKIAATQARAARCRKQGWLAEASAKLNEIEVLKAEHELLKACRDNQQLAEYVRKLQSLHNNSWEGPIAHGMCSARKQALSWVLVAVATRAAFKGEEPTSSFEFHLGREPPDSAKLQTLMRPSGAPGWAELPLAARARRKGPWVAGWSPLLLLLAAWASAGRSLAVVAGPRAKTCRSSAPGFCETLEEVRRKNKQLRIQLSKSPWPTLSCFSAKGRTYSLPLRAERRDLRRLPPEPVLAYLAGFFDGDGCVACKSNLSGCYLHVGQSFDQAEVLMLLHETFGGSITLQFRGRDLRKPVLQWMACGESARNAAQLLAPQSLAKQKQLLLAAQWPEAKSNRKDCKAELRALKEYDSAVAGPCSWEYCAGFFDAEGYIQQRSGGVSLGLQIKQKHPRVLECLREFWAQSLGKDARLAKAGLSAHVLSVWGLTYGKQILQHLLAAGLLCKAEQAKLVLGLTPETAAHVNAELGRLTGNQKFGKRLDPAGQKRARKILVAQHQVARFRQRGRLVEARAGLGVIEVLKAEHELLKADYENQQLVEYMNKVQSLHNNSWQGPFAHDM